MVGIFNNRNTMEPITIAGIIAALVSHQSIAGMITGVLGSYFANHIPLLLKAHPDFEKSAKKCFCKAAKEWSKIDETRSAIYTCWLQSYEEFIEFLSWNHPNKELVTSELIPMWMDRMRNNEDCRQLVVELELNKLEVIAQNVLKEQKENKVILETIEAYIKRFRSKGTMVFEPVECYICRSCDEIETNIGFLRSINCYQEKTLLEYVMKGSREKEKANRFIIYSSMQTGKTTELEQLGWLLQKSELYQPILISLSLVPNLNFDDLPEDDWIGRKPIVLLIDALDETREGRYCELIRNIDNYVKHHKNMIIVMSSRFNFRSMGKPVGFTELELLPLRRDQIKQYVEEKLKGDAGGLLQAIHEKNLYEMASIPLCLNTLIRIYSDRRGLPSTTAELYAELFQGTYYVEDEKKLKDLPSLTKEEEKRCMEFAAGMMLCLGRRELIDEEFKTILPYDIGIEYEHLRYDIIQRRKVKEGNLYSFKQNAMFEYMAACLLLHCKNMELLKKTVCYKDTEVLKDSWFSAMLLWLEMLGSEAPNMKDAVRDWLLKDCHQLAIHAPEDLISENERGWLIVNILEQCRKDNSYFYGYGNDLIPKKRRLPKCLIEYMLSEWGNMNAITPHLKNIQNLTRMIDWNHLRKMEPELADAMTEMLYGKLNDPLFKEGAAEWIYSAMANEYFYTPEHVRRLYEALKDRTDIESIETMTARVAIQEHPEEYADYLFKTNAILMNRMDDYSYRTVYRESLYMALSKMHAFECPAKMLDIIGNDNYWRWAEDRKLANEISLKLQEEVKASACYKEGGCELECQMAKVDNMRLVWMSSYKELPPEEEEKRRKRNEEYERGELRVLFDKAAFKEQALKVIDRVSENGEDMEVSRFFDLEFYGDGQDHISRYVMNFLLRFIPSDNKKMKCQDALKYIEDQGLFFRYRLGEMGDYLTGTRKMIELTPEQTELCLNTAQEVITDMIVTPFNGGILSHEQTALTLLVQEKIGVEKNRNNCKGLLRYIGVPLDHKMDNLFDDAQYSCLLEHLRSYVGEEVMLELMLELTVGARMGEFDLNAYNFWMTTMLNNNYSPAIEYVRNKIINDGHRHWLEWIPYLVKKDCEVACLITHAEKQVGALEDGHFGYANVALVLKLAEELLENMKYRDWARTLLERTVIKADATEMKVCLTLLFKYGSRRALDYVLSENISLSRGDNYDFNYDKIEDVSLLVAFYEKSKAWELFSPSYNSILQSLAYIAMKNEECLRIVQEEVKNGITTLAESASLTPLKWADNLTYQYRSEHQYLANAKEALDLLNTLVA